jgi:hypothetical protein
VSAEIDRPAPSARTSANSPDAALITALHSLRALGRFEEAASMVRVADAGSMAGKLTPRGHAAAGPALAAVSDYAAAQVHLMLASVEPALAPAALAQLAELAWIEHDHARGRALALAGLALDPSQRNCRIQLHRNENARSLRRESGADTQLDGGLAHVAGFADPQGNAGDRALADAVQRCFAGAPALTGPPARRAGDAAASGETRGGWHELHVHQLFDERRLAEVNATQGLVVGGGGLFLPDAAPNGNSGWQWNISDAVLARIEVPLVVWAVGYNVFEGQTFEGQTFEGRPDDGPAFGELAPGRADSSSGRFARSLRALVERSAFVGMRNHGSVDRVRELLPDELADRVGWQPCPTAITDLLADPPSPIQPTEPDRPGSASPPPGVVLLNCAYDRAGRRFGDDYGAFLGGLRDWVLRTRERADVWYAAHCADDERFVSDLRREHGITLPVIALYDLTPAQIYQQYRQAQLVVGMRGHAATIPFGCGTPIVSLTSHPKLGYFLDDIDRPQWGLQVRDPHLGDRLWDVTCDVLDNAPAVAADIAEIRRKLAKVTAHNLSSLPEQLHPAQLIGQDETSE